MFAQDGVEGNDDPYNFDITDRYGGGGGSKKGSARKTGGGKLSGGRSHQSRLKQSVLNKTVGSTPSSTSVKAQGPADLSRDFSAAAIDPRTAPLRASAPAATSSALDKAMGFLNKYSTPPTGAANVGLNVGKRSSGTANTNADDEAEMDISLSSEDIGAEQTFPRKVQSRLKANKNSHDELGISDMKHQVSRSLTGVRSTRFATAKELGVGELGALAGPKASVSPLGLQNQRRDTVHPVGSRFETNKDSQIGDVRVSDLPLAANIPRSLDSDAVKHGRGSDKHGSDGEVASSLESIHSAVAGTLEEIRQEAHAVESGQRHIDSAFLELGSSREFDDEGGSGSVSPTLGREGAQLETVVSQDERHSSSTSYDKDRGFAHTTLGNVVSIEHLAAVSGQHTEPTLSHRDGNNMDDDDDDTGGHQDGSAGNRVSNIAEVEDDEDDYGDDDFEEVEGNTEGENSPTAGCRRTVNLVAMVLQDSASCEANPATGQIIGGGGSHVDPNDDRQHHVQRHTPTTSFVPAPLVGNSISSGDLAVSCEPRQVWNNLDPPGKSYSPRTTDSGTSPLPQPEPRTCASHDERRSTSAVSTPIVPGKARRDIKQAWSGGLASGSHVVDGGNFAHPVSAPTRCMNISVARHPPPGAGECGGERPATLGGVSKRGVVMDRSAERRSSGPPPGIDVKVVYRAETVAAVEYSHDPERGLNLRSCGTQAVGSSAAVQVNIAVPGMVGTYSALDAAPRAHALRTPGVGYQSGEPYAKWGRFACNFPEDGFSARDYTAAAEVQEAATTRSPPSPPRQRPRSSMGATNKDRIEETDASCVVGDIDGVDGDNCDFPSRGDSRSRPEREEASGGTNADTPTTSHPPPVRGTPAYLQIFLNSMAEAQADSYSAWQHVLEDMVRKQHFLAFPGDDQSRQEEKKDSSVGEDEEEVHLDRATGLGESQWPESSDVGVDMFGVITSTQDSFKRQLAIMRENLNKILWDASARCVLEIGKLLLYKPKRNRNREYLQQVATRPHVEIRYRAEVAGRQGCAYNYESLAQTREVSARTRPSATNQAKALRTVEPCLTAEEAPTLAHAGQPDPVPTIHVEPSEPLEHTVPTET